MLQDHIHAASHAGPLVMGTSQGSYSEAVLEELGVSCHGRDNSLDEVESLAALDLGERTGSLKARRLGAGLSSRRDFLQASSRSQVD